MCILYQIIWLAKIATKYQRGLLTNVFTSNQYTSYV